MSAGDASYFGFEYQIYASVFLMLIEHQNLTFSEMIIETPFGHDAAIFSNPSTISTSSPEEEKNLIVSLNSGSRIKQIQVKTKVRHYMWNPSEIRKVLLKQDESVHSGGKVPTVLDSLLNNPQEIFIFFTDGVVHPDLAGLRADPTNLHRKQPGENLSKVVNSIIKKDRDMPLETQLQSLNTGVFERIFIIDGLEIDVLKTLIGDIICKTYSIPYHQRTEKMYRLVALVRQTMLRENRRDCVTLGELEQIVGIPSPKVPYSELVDNFVPIPEYDRVLDVLEKEHVAIICGEPCVGKTTIARAAVNSYFEKNYEWTLLQGSDAHLHIASSCMKNETRIFLVDDGLGLMNYENQSALADQLPQLIAQIKNANGRIKLVLTTRQNVLAEAKGTSRLGGANIDRYIVYIPPPNTTHLNNVFNKLLSGFSDEDKQLIKTSNLISYFENMLHLRHFVDGVRHVQVKTSVNLADCLEASRPSQYRKWIKTQSPANQLCLFILWMLLETNGFTNEDDLRRIYSLAENHAHLPAPPPFGNRFNESLQDLVFTKNRIEGAPNGTLNFIHPNLRNAVKEFLCNDGPGISTFLGKLSTQLSNVDHPLEQSVASLLCLFFRKQFGSDAAQNINKLLYSRFIQVIETIIRFGGVPLVISFLENSSAPETEKANESKIALLRAQFLYSPGQCRLDENGHLVRKTDIFDRFVLGSEAAEQREMEWALKSGQVSDQKQGLFRTLLTQDNFGVLNPLERYAFAYWLYRNRDTIEPHIVVETVKNLANDSISFVRKTAAIFMDQETLLTSQDYQSIFQHLCYDGHPNVKLEILERVILPNWRFMPEETKEEWLRIVSDMLDDPIVRLHSSMGLIDQSGTFAHYHIDHSPEQKRKWFIALAPKLIAHGFEHHVHFDRFLTPVDEDFIDLPIPFRTELLRSIADYIEKKPSLSENTLYSIEKIVLEGNTTPEENDICLRLIRDLSSWGKSRICYTFASKFSLLKDERFRQFVHYPFYNESESQFVAERAAALLGFRVNPSMQLSDLPPAICKDNLATVTHTLNEYCCRQSDDFKLLSVMMAYGYGSACHTGAINDDCFRLDIIDELVVYFSKHADLEKVRVVVEIILNRLRLWDSENQAQSIQSLSVDCIKESERFRRLELFLYNQNSEIGKCVCEIVFASNIASSVHNVKTFLFLVHLLLNHPDASVSHYAFTFFDKYFHEIEKVMFDPDLPSSWHKEIADTWFNDEFQARLLENSSVYKQWLQSDQFFRTVASVWSELSDDLRDNTISLIQAFAWKDRPEIIEILREFYYKIQDSIPDEQKERIKIWLDIQQNPHTPDILVEKHLANCEELEQLFAKVDWAIYFDF